MCPYCYWTSIPIGLIDATGIEGLFIKQKHDRLQLVVGTSYFIVSLA